MFQWLQVSSIVNKLNAQKWLRWTKKCTKSSWNSPEWLIGQKSVPTTKRNWQDWSTKMTTKPNMKSINRTKTLSLKQSWNDYFSRYRDILHRNFSSLEDSPSIAFAIVTHDQLGLFELLLHSIFRPENAYCIYVGANSPNEYRVAMEELVHCYNQMYPNTSVFMAQNVTGVSWGNYSLIEADLKCMDQLLQLKDQ